MTTVGYVAIIMLIAGLAAVIVLLLILLRRPAASRRTAMPLPNYVASWRSWQNNPARCSRPSHPDA